MLPLLRLEPTSPRRWAIQLFAPQSVFQACLVHKSAIRWHYLVLNSGWAVLDFLECFGTFCFLSVFSVLLSIFWCNQKKRNVPTPISRSGSLIHERLFYCEGKNIKPDSRKLTACQTPERRAGGWWCETRKCLDRPLFVSTQWLHIHRKSSRLLDGSFAVRFWPFECFSSNELG